MENKVRLEIHDTIAEMVLDRPEKLNALDRECLELIDEHLDTVERNPDVRAIIVRGEGRAFCAGADLEYLEDKVSDPHAFGQFLDLWHHVYTRIHESPTPTIAAVDGLALAGGFELLEACDFAVLADDARIGDQHATFGLFPGGGSTQRLPRLVGERRAKWLLFSGEWIDSSDALAFGLVNAVTPGPEVLERARSMAATLVKRSPLATATIKRAVHLGREMDLRSALEIERMYAVAHMQSQDVQIGLEAFKNRTDPVFIGR